MTKNLLTTSSQPMRNRLAASRLATAVRASTNAIDLAADVGLIPGSRRLALRGVGAAVCGSLLGASAVDAFAADTSGVAPTAASASRAPLKVVATFSILADMVREVGGSAVSVSTLVGANADAHVFEPTPSDVRRVAAADLVVANGLRYEGWIERLIAASGYRGKVLIASRGITPRRVPGGADPHAWQSLAHAQQYVENIRAALSDAAPGESALIGVRAAAYSARLAGLDAAARSRFGAIPADRRRVITSHDAFGYFGDAYGIAFIAPRGWTTGSEPSAETVAAIIRQARAERASALLVENISDPRLVERIGREAGLNVGGTLYSDALSPPGTLADTYLRMVAHNIDTLVAAMAPVARPPTTGTNRP
jgi:ABC-type Zn uptake system ZnuABC Zn-binding protein ZnuA